jgi:hypothetical protein
MPSGHPTRPGGFPTLETMEPTEMAENLKLTDTGTRRKYAPSMSFIVALSIVFGLILAVGSVVGVLGKAFYVSRDEYVEKNLKDAEEATTVRNTLDRVEKALSRQEASFDKLSDAVQAIKVDMAKGK